MFGERETIVDPDLGESAAIGGSRSWIALAMIGAALLVYMAWSALQGRLTATPSQAVVITATGVFFCVFAVWTSRTKLLIGQRGFRYARPFRTVQASWSKVGEITVQGRPRSMKLVVPLFEGGSESTFRPLNNFSVNITEIRDLMNAARLAVVGNNPDSVGGPPAESEGSSGLQSVGRPDWPTTFHGSSDSGSGESWPPEPSHGLPPRQNLLPLQPIGGMGPNQEPAPGQSVETPLPAYGALKTYPAPPDGPPGYPPPPSYLLPTPTAYRPSPAGYALPPGYPHLGYGHSPVPPGYGYGPIGWGHAVRPGPTPGLVWAGIGVRVGALVLDAAFFCVFAVVLSEIMHTPGLETVNGTVQYQTLANVIDVVSWVVVLSYVPASWYLFAGTPGQRLLGLRVLRASDGRSLGIRRVFFRYVVWAFCLCGLCIPALIAAVLANNDPRKRAWTDYAGDSVVVGKA